MVEILALVHMRLRKYLGMSWVIFHLGMSWVIFHPEILAFIRYELGHFSWRGPCWNYLRFLNLVSGHILSFIFVFPVAFGIVVAPLLLSGWLYVRY